LETKQAREELKGEFARLVAQATAQVTGKVLNEEDHRRINRELIDKINS
jgi:F-type H+-transporting ATPase subunit b